MVPGLMLGHVGVQHIRIRGRGKGLARKHVGGAVYLSAAFVYVDTNTNE